MEQRPSAPINTERTSEAHAAQLGEAQDQIDRLTSENDDLRDELTEVRIERTTASDQRDALQEQDCTRAAIPDQLQLDGGPTGPPSDCTRAAIPGQLQLDGGPTGPPSDCTRPPIPNRPLTSPPPPAPPPTPNSPR